MSPEVHPYATEEYALTLRDIGRPIHVPEWKTYVLERQVTHCHVDAVGPYPLTVISGGGDFRAGLERLREAGLVSLTFVSDELCGVPASELQPVLSLMRPFKTHYLVDRAVGAYMPNDHHRREILRASKCGVSVRIVRLDDIIDSWIALYEQLAISRGISGFHRYSRVAFERLANCPGLITIAGFIGDELASCHLWFEYEGLAWSHLGASSSLGYKSSAAFAVYDHSIRHLPCRTINLGGVAGLADTADSGLARFKRGFSNACQKAYLCGAVLDPIAYRALCEGRRAGSAYFPAYRAP